MLRPPRRQTFAEYLATEKVNEVFRANIRELIQKLTTQAITVTRADLLFNNFPTSKVVQDYFTNQPLGDEFQRVFPVISNNVLAKGEFKSNEELSAVLQTREWIQFVRKSFIKAIDDIIDHNGQINSYLVTYFTEEGLVAAFPDILINDEFKWILISSYVSMFVCGAQDFQSKFSNANSVLILKPENEDSSFSLYTAARGYFSHLLDQIKPQVLQSSLKVDERFRDRMHDFFDHVVKGIPSAVEVDMRQSLSKSTLAADLHARENELLDLYGTEIIELAKLSVESTDALLTRFLQDRYLINIALRNSKIFDASIEGNALDLVYRSDFLPKQHASTTLSCINDVLQRNFTNAELEASGYPAYLIVCEHTTPTQREALVLSAVVETVGKLIAEVVHPFKIGVDSTTTILLRKKVETDIEKSLQGKLEQYAPSLHALTKKYSSSSVEVEEANERRYALERNKQNIRQYLMDFYRTNAYMMQSGVIRESTLTFPYNFLRNANPDYDFTNEADIRISSVESIHSKYDQFFPNLFINASEAYKSLPKWDVYYLNSAVAALRDQLETETDREMLDEAVRDFSAEEFIELAKVTSLDHHPHVAAFIKTFNELEWQDVGKLPGNKTYQAQVLADLKEWLKTNDFLNNKEEMERKTLECEAHVKKLAESKAVCLAYTAARDALSLYEAKSDDEKEIRLKALMRVLEMEKIVSDNPANYFALLKQDCEDTVAQLQLIRKKNDALHAEKHALAVKRAAYEAIEKELAVAVESSKKRQEQLNTTLEKTARKNAELQTQLRAAKDEAASIQANLDGVNGKLALRIRDIAELQRRNKELTDRPAIAAAPIEYEN